MSGIWSFLRQLMYAKFIVVVDDDVNPRDWKDVIWAITTKVDPPRCWLTTRRLTISILLPQSAAWAARWALTPPTSGPAKPVASGANG